jgi:predicted RNA-binding Zn ribbon-like protein
LTAYAGEVPAVDPRPLLGEPLPLDLINTTWMMSADGPMHDLLKDEAGTRIFLDGHGFDAPADAAARRALRDTREALRALLADPTSPTARHRVNAVLERGGQRPLLGPGGIEMEVDAAVTWRVPWICAAAMVSLLETRADRIRGCANPDCVLWFLDTSRPGTRRWCSMAACGNRDKAIRHGRSHQ